MTVTHQCVRSGAGGHSVYTPVLTIGVSVKGVLGDISDTGTIGRWERMLCL